MMSQQHGNQLRHAAERVPKRVCKYCGGTFSSRNGLFRHFASGGQCTERAIQDGMPPPRPPHAPERAEVCWGDGSSPMVRGAPTLVVGECDFSFSVALTSVSNLGAELCATALANSEAECGDGKVAKCVRKNVALLRKRGATVVFGTDATALGMSLPWCGRLWQRIIFCFPRARLEPAARRGVRPANNALLSGFFASALPLLAKGGRIALLLNVCSLNGVPADQWEEWGLSGIAETAGLERVALREWRPAHFPQYQPRAVGGMPFVPGTRRGVAASTEEPTLGGPAALWHMLAPTSASALRRNEMRLQRHAAPTLDRECNGATETPVPEKVARALAPFQVVCELRASKLRSPECVYLDRCFLPSAAADALFEELRDSLHWQERPRNRRLTAFYGESPTPSILRPWTPALLRVKRLAEQWYTKRTGLELAFNVSVLNFYRDGQDGIGWHCDFEEFGRSTPIASISLGAPRTFLLRGCTAACSDDRVQLTLPHGSLMIMENLCQHRYVHSVPRDKDVRTGRINITFRVAPETYLRSRHSSYF